MALLPYGDGPNAPESVTTLLAKMPVRINVARMVANSEGALRPFLKLGEALLSRARLDGKLRELAILRTAKLSRSIYEWTQHLPIARATGVSEEQIAAMEHWERATCFSDEERLVLRFTDQVALGIKANHETVTELHRHMSTAEIVELTLSVGFWGMVARLLETTEVDLEDFAGKMNLIEESPALRRPR